MFTNKLKINDSKTEFIVFRFPHLKCDLSDLPVNVGESIITQSSKVRDLRVIFDQFLNFDDHITAKLGIYYRMMVVLLLFMHLLVVDYIIVIPFCTMFQKVKLIDYKDFRINVRVS